MQVILLQYLFYFLRRRFNSDADNAMRDIAMRKQLAAFQTQGIILERKVLYLEKNTGRKGLRGTVTAIRTPKLDKGYVQQWAYSNEPPTG